MEEKVDYELMRAKWIESAYLMLCNGQSHMSIITFLRSKGLSNDNAKKLSVEIFTEAKKRLIKEQRFNRITAYFFIVIGVILPIALFLSGWLVPYAVAPIILGMGILYKLPNPKPLF